MVIQWLSYDGFPAPRWLLGFMTFHIHAKTNSSKNKV